jgi:hypothetical protein
MRAFLCVLAAAFAAGPWIELSAATADETDALATVNRYIDGNNKNDADAANAECAPQATILDSFPPYVWQGSGTCATWWKDVVAFDDKNGITDAIVTADKPWRVDVSGDRAYVVVPVKYTYKQNGKSVSEDAVWTFAQQKVAAGWRITGWAWSQH